jgi:hypothetical protein
LRQEQYVNRNLLNKDKAMPTRFDAVKWPKKICYKLRILSGPSMFGIHTKYLLNGYVKSCKKNNPTNSKLYNFYNINPFNHQFIVNF